MSPRNGLDAEGNVTDLGRVMLLAAEINLRVRAAAMVGEVISLDAVERIDPLTGGPYMELLVSGSTTEAPDDDSGREAPTG